VALPAIFGLGSALGSDLAAGPYVRAAHNRPPLAESRLISSYITSTTGKAPQQLTIVSGEHALLVTKPYFSFLPLHARYAHPLAHLAQRIEVLRAAARCLTAACTTRELTHSQFGRIDALVLARTFAGPRIQTEEDSFPEPVPVQIYFRRRNLDPAVWARRNFPGYVVFVRRDPAPASQPSPATGRARVMTSGVGAS
jgi:arabinofuranosyltransferase-like protein